MLILLFPHSDTVIMGIRTVATIGTSRRRWTHSLTTGWPSGRTSTDPGPARGTRIRHGRDRAQPLEIPCIRGRPSQRRCEPAYQRPDLAHASPRYHCSSSAGGRYCRPSDEKSATYHKAISVYRRNIRCATAGPSVPVPGREGTVLRKLNTAIENSCIIIPDGTEGIDRTETTDGAFTPRGEQ